MALTKEEIEYIRQNTAPYAPATTMEKEGKVTLPGGDLTLYPTGEEVRKATATGVAQGVISGTGTMGGLMTGLRTGTAVAPFTGPAAPLMPVAGAIVGAGLGFLGTEQLDKLLFEDIVAAQRPEVAPYREGGKTFGQSISAAPALFGLPKMTGNRVSRFISDIGETARKNPKAFLGAEIITGAAAGVAGGTAYAIDPEDKATRLIAEVSAGMFTPTRIIAQSVAGTYDFLKNAGYMTAGGREMLAQNQAADRLRAILEEAGEDVPKLIRLLEKPLPGSVPSPTAAQKTGSLVVSEIERALGNLNVKFAADTRAQGNEALRAYGLMVERLRDIGTPEALTRAAQMRSQLFDQMLESRLANADADAARKIVKIKQDTPQSRAEIGQIVKDETSKALLNAREAERLLWDEALRQVTAPVKTTVKIPKTAFLSPKTIEMLGPEEALKAMQTGVIPKTVTKMEAPVLAASNTYEAFLKRASTIGDAAYDSVVPAVVRDIMQDLGATKSSVLAYKSARNTPEARQTGDVMAQMPGSYKPKEVNVSELINYRSNLLGLARQAASRGETEDANLYSTLADAMLTDLNKLKSPAFDAARDFSRALNDTFTRTFAKTATFQADVTRTGAERLPAEILVMNAFGRNADVTAQRMLAIENAARFPRAQYEEAVAKFGAKSDQAQMLKPHAELADQGVVSIQDAQTRILRLMASKAIDPITGRVNPKQLQTFVNENKMMLDKVGLTNDLTDAVKAELALKQVATENSVLNRTLRQQTAFAQVLKGGETPTAAVADVLNSRSPVLGMNRMMQLAEAGGPSAVGGLKATLMDYAFTKAGGIDNFDPMAFRTALFAPLGPNKPSLVGLMRQHGMMDFGEMRGINEMIRPMLRIQDAMANKQTLEGFEKATDIVTDFALRSVGSKVGSQAGGTLIAQSAGSKIMRDIFDKMPSNMTRAFMEDAMKDPALMAMLLQKATSPQQGRDLARSVVSRLVSSGVLPAAMINYVDQQPEPAPRRPTAAEMLERLPPAPPTRGTPAAPAASGAKPPAGAAPGKVSMGPQERNAYQALFPQDTISSLMAMQPSQG